MVLRKVYFHRPFLNIFPKLHILNTFNVFYMPNKNSPSYLVLAELFKCLEPSSTSQYNTSICLFFTIDRHVWRCSWVCWKTRGHIYHRHRPEIKPTKISVSGQTETSCILHQEIEFGIFQNTFILWNWKFQHEKPSETSLDFLFLTKRNMKPFCELSTWIIAIERNSLFP